MTDTTETPSAGSSAPGRRFRPELIVEFLAAVVMIVMMLHITANALLRTFWHEPLSNTLEITQYWYMPTIAFLGFIAAESRGQHVAADLIYERLPEVSKKYVLAVIYVVIGIVSAYFAWWSWGEALHAMDIKKVAGVSDVPAWPTYFLAPLAFAILAIQLLAAAPRTLIKGDTGHVPTDVDEAIVSEVLDEMVEQKR